MGRLLAVSCANMARHAALNITATNPHRSPASFMRFSLGVTLGICLAGLWIVSRFVLDAKGLTQFFLEPSFRCNACRSKSNGFISFTVNYLFNGTPTAQM